MNEIQELIAYKEKSGKTHEQLALEIGVSIYTIQRWFHGFACSRMGQSAIRLYLKDMVKREAKS